MPMRVSECIDIDYYIRSILSITYIYTFIKYEKYKYLKFLFLIFKLKD